MTCCKIDFTIDIFAEKEIDTQRNYVTTRQKQGMKLRPSDSKSHMQMIDRRKYQMDIHRLTSAVMWLCGKTKTVMSVH